MGRELKCHICNNKGNNGIVLLNKRICRECELELTKAFVGEPEYEGFKEKIKNIWRDFHKNVNTEIC